MTHSAEPQVLLPYIAVEDSREFSSLALVRTRWTTRILAAVLIAFVGASGLFLAVTPWVQTVAGTGRVIAFTPAERQQSVDAPVEGRIVRWHVAEGARVKPGDLLAEIADNDPALMSRLVQEREALTGRLQAARLREDSFTERIAGLEGSRRNALSAAESRVEMAIDRRQAAQQALEAAEAARRTAELNLDRQKRLLQKGLTSTRNVELAELEMARTATDVDRAKAALRAAENEKLALASDREKTETDFKASLEDAKATRASARAEIANAAAELQRMDVRLARQQTQTIRAPRAGTIWRIIAQPGGDILKPGDPLAVLIPDTDKPVVELWVSGNDMPLLSEGRKARLQFEGWPALQFSGWPSVAVGTFGGRVVLIDSTDNGQGKFRVLVAPDEHDEPWPSHRYLRQGVRANGWVLLNSVPLWYELWRQFNGFPPVIAPSEPGAAGASGGGK